MLVVKIALFSFVYVVVLGENGMIMSYVHRFFNNYVGDVENDWRFKFWLSCEKCVAGQIALWLYPVYCPYEISITGIFDHLFYVMTTILMVWILKKIYERIR